MIVYTSITSQGGVSSGYKNSVKENGTFDETYSEEGLALFRVQGYGPENMQAIQVEPVDLVHKIKQFFNIIFNLVFF